ncbi:unnamed protein product [Blepharisma stoltei]|uniref:Uncharacterized protein n=1 Tax=Blepharisma stoltei TaxID=1481888 RepID=A0AAU9IDJ1_9CILI|nr:unnamed protein product [Blepharisma stoltei]
MDKSNEAIIRNIVVQLTTAIQRQFTEQQKIQSLMANLNSLIDQTFGIEQTKELLNSLTSNEDPGFQPRCLVLAIKVTLIRKKLQVKKVKYAFNLIRCLYKDFKRESTIYANSLSISRPISLFNNSPENKTKFVDVSDANPGKSMECLLKDLSQSAIHIPKLKQRNKDIGEAWRIQKEKATKGKLLMFWHQKMLAKKFKNFASLNNCNKIFKKCMGKHFNNFLQSGTRRARSLSSLSRVVKRANKRKFQSPFNFWKRNNDKLSPKRSFESFNFASPLISPIYSLESLPKNWIYPQDPNKEEQKEVPKLQESPKTNKIPFQKYKTSKPSKSKPEESESLSGKDISKQNINVSFEYDPEKEKRNEPVESKNLEDSPRRLQLSDKPRIHELPKSEVSNPNLLSVEATPRFNIKNEEFKSQNPKNPEDIIGATENSILSKINQLDQIDSLRQSIEGDFNFTEESSDINPELRSPTSEPIKNPLKFPKNKNQPTNQRYGEDEINIEENLSDIEPDSYSSSDKVESNEIRSENKPKKGAKQGIKAAQKMREESDSESNLSDSPKDPENKDIDQIEYAKRDANPAIDQVTDKPDIKEETDKPDIKEETDKSNIKEETDKPDIKEEIENLERQIPKMRRPIISPYKKAKGLFSENPATKEENIIEIPKIDLEKIISDEIYKEDECSSDPQSNENWHDSLYQSPENKPNLEENSEKICSDIEYEEECSPKPKINEKGYLSAKELTENKPEKSSPYAKYEEDNYSSNPKINEKRGGSPKNKLNFDEIPIIGRDITSKSPKKSAKKIKVRSKKPQEDKQINPMQHEQEDYQHIQESKVNNPNQSVILHEQEDYADTQESKVTNPDQSVKEDKNRLMGIGIQPENKMPSFDPSERPILEQDFSKKASKSPKRGVRSSANKNQTKDREKYNEEIANKQASPIEKHTNYYEEPKKPSYKLSFEEGEHQSEISDQEHEKHLLDNRLRPAEDLPSTQLPKEDEYLPLVQAKAEYQTPFEAQELRREDSLKESSFGASINEPSTKKARNLSRIPKISFKILEDSNQSEIESSSQDPDYNVPLRSQSDNPRSSRSSPSTAENTKRSPRDPLTPKSKIPARKQVRSQTVAQRSSNVLDSPREKSAEKIASPKDNKSYVQIFENKKEYYQDKQTKARLSKAHYSKSKSLGNFHKDLLNNPETPIKNDRISSIFIEERKKDDARDINVNEFVLPEVSDSPKKTVGKGRRSKSDVYVSSDIKSKQFLDQANTPDRSNISRPTKLRRDNLWDSNKSENGTFPSVINPGNDNLSSSNIPEKDSFSSPIKSERYPLSESSKPGARDHLTLVSGDEANKEENKVQEDPFAITEDKSKSKTEDKKKTSQDIFQKGKQIEDSSIIDEEPFETKKQIEEDPLISLPEEEAFVSAESSIGSPEQKKAQRDPLSYGKKRKPRDSPRTSQKNETKSSNEPLAYKEDSADKPISHHENKANLSNKQKVPSNPRVSFQIEENKVQVNPLARPQKEKIIVQPDSQISVLKEEISMPTALLACEPSEEGNTAKDPLTLPQKVKAREPRDTLAYIPAEIAKESENPSSYAAKDTKNEGPLIQEQKGKKEASADPSISMPKAGNKFVSDPFAIDLIKDEETPSQMQGKGNKKIEPFINKEREEGKTRAGAIIYKEREEGQKSPDPFLEPLEEKKNDKDSINYKPREEQKIAEANYFPQNEENTTPGYSSYMPMNKSPIDASSNQDLIKKGDKSSHEEYLTHKSTEENNISEDFSKPNKDERNFKSTNEQKDEKIQDKNKIEKGSTVPEGKKGPKGLKNISGDIGNPRGESDTPEDIDSKDKSYTFEDSEEPIEDRKNTTHPREEVLKTKGPMASRKVNEDIAKPLELIKVMESDRKPSTDNKLTESVAKPVEEIKATENAIRTPKEDPTMTKKEIDKAKAMAMPEEDNKVATGDVIKPSKEASMAKEVAEQKEGSELMDAIISSPKDINKTSANSRQENKSTQAVTSSRQDSSKTAYENEEPSEERKSSKTLVDSKEDINKVAKESAKPKIKSKLAKTTLSLQEDSKTVVEAASPKEESKSSKNQIVPSEDIELGKKTQKPNKENKSADLKAYSKDFDNSPTISIPRPKEESKSTDVKGNKKEKLTDESIPTDSGDIINEADRENVKPKEESKATEGKIISSDDKRAKYIANPMEERKSIDATIHPRYDKESNQTENIMSPSENAEIDKDKTEPLEKNKLAEAMINPNENTQIGKDAEKPKEKNRSPAKRINPMENAMRSKDSPKSKDESKLHEAITSQAEDIESDKDIGKTQDESKSDESEIESGEHIREIIDNAEQKEIKKPAEFIGDLNGSIRTVKDNPSSVIMKHKDDMSVVENSDKPKEENKAKDAIIYPDSKRTHLQEDSYSSNSTKPQKEIRVTKGTAKPIEEPDKNKDMAKPIEKAKTKDGIIEPSDEKNVRKGTVKPAREISPITKDITNPEEEMEMAKETSKPAEDFDINPDIVEPLEENKTAKDSAETSELAGGISKHIGENKAVKDIDNPEEFGKNKYIAKPIGEIKSKKDTANPKEENQATKETAIPLEELGTNKYIAKPIEQIEKAKDKAKNPAKEIGSNKYSAKPIEEIKSADNIAKPVESNYIPKPIEEIDTTKDKAKNPAKEIGSNKYSAKPIEENEPTDDIAKPVESNYIPKPIEEIDTAKDKANISKEFEINKYTAKPIEEIKTSTNIEKAIEEETDKSKFIAKPTKLLRIKKDISGPVEEIKQENDIEHLIEETKITENLKKSTGECGINKGLESPVEETDKPKGITKPQEEFRINKGMEKQMEETRARNDFVKLHEEEKKIEEGAKSNTATEGIKKPAGKSKAAEDTRNQTDGIREAENTIKLADGNQTEEEIKEESSKPKDDDKEEGDCNKSEDTINAIEENKIVGQAQEINPSQHSLKQFDKKTITKDLSTDSHDQRKKFNFNTEKSDLSVQASKAMQEPSEVADELHKALPIESEYPKPKSVAFAINPLENQINIETEKRISKAPLKHPPRAPVRSSKPPETEKFVVLYESKGAGLEGDTKKIRKPIVRSSKPPPPPPKMPEDKDTDLSKKASNPLGRSKSQPLRSSKNQEPEEFLSDSSLQKAIAGVLGDLLNSAVKRIHHKHKQVAWKKLHKSEISNMTKTDCVRLVIMPLWIKLVLRGGFEHFKINGRQSIFAKIADSFDSKLVSPISDDDSPIQPAGKGNNFEDILEEVNLPGTALPPKDKGQSLRKSKEISTVSQPPFQIAPQQKASQLSSNLIQTSNDTVKIEPDKTNTTNKEKEIRNVFISRAANLLSKILKKTIIKQEFKNALEAIKNYEENVKISKKINRFAQIFIKISLKPYFALILKPPKSIFTNKAKTRHPRSRSSSHIKSNPLSKNVPIKLLTSNLKGKIKDSLSFSFQKILNFSSQNTPSPNRKRQGRPQIVDRRNTLIFEFLMQKTVQILQFRLKSSAFKYIQESSVFSSNYQKYKLGLRNGSEILSRTAQPQWKYQKLKDELSFIKTSNNLHQKLLETLPTSISTPSIHSRKSSCFSPRVILPPPKDIHDYINDIIELSREKVEASYLSRPSSRMTSRMSSPTRRYY